MLTIFTRPEGTNCTGAQYRPFMLHHSMGYFWTDIDVMLPLRKLRAECAEDNMPGNRACYRLPLMAVEKQCSRFDVD